MLFAFDPARSALLLLGGRLDLVADFGDRTVRLPVSDTATAA